jgi:hypothetical protein
MILISTKESTPFTPPWELNGDGSPKPGASVFYLRAGSMIERGQMEAELSGIHRAGIVYGFETLAAIRSGLLTLLEGDPQLDRALGLVDAEAQGEVAGLSDDDTQMLVELRKILAEHWPDYRDLLAQSERRRQIAPLVALRRFCTGIEADDVTFALGRDGQVSDATLAPIDPMVLAVAGARAFNLQYPSSAEGNSQRPSKSDEGQQTSNSGGASKAVGSSRGGLGKKTPA